MINHDSDININEKINEFSLLSDNWDGYDSISIIENVVDISRELVSSLDNQYVTSMTDIFPNPSGTITMEWEMSIDELVSLEIGDGGGYSFFATYLNEHPYFMNGVNIIQDIKLLTDKIDKLFK